MTQIFDQWVEDKWSEDSCQFQPVDTTSDLWPNYLCSTDYDPLLFENSQSHIDPVFAYNLPLSSSLPAFELPSPISDSSSLDEENLFDETQFSSSWVLPTALNDTTINQIASWATFSGENSPTTIMDTPDLTSSSDSSRSNSPLNSEHEEEEEAKKKSSKQSRKQSKSAPSGCHKSHNLIEKRYRNNLNSKIMSLGARIPSLRAKHENKDGEDATDSDTGDSRKAKKWNKGVILEKALTYIAELEKEKEELAKENARLRKDRSSLSSYLYANGVRQKEMVRQQSIY